MRYHLIRWAVAVAAAIGILGLAAESASAAGCGDSWTNAAGGAWSTGSNWSTKAPPTSTQSACIKIALSGPVTFSGTASVASLTLGGSSGSAELLFDGGDLTIGGNSTIADTGQLTTEGSSVNIEQRGTLTNHGTIAPDGSGVRFLGNMTNAADGLIAASSGGLYFEGPGTLTNDGQLSLSGNAALAAPYNGGSKATIVNAGSIQNTSTTTLTIGAGATLEETTGTTTGTPLQISGGTLDLTGSGASRYELTQNATLKGTVASGQTLILDGNASTAGSLTSKGTIAGGGGGTLTVPSGHTLTNDGSIVASSNLYMAGDLVNAASGRLAVVANGFAVYGPVTLTNEGTITVAPSANIDFNASSSSGPFGTIDNAGGTIENGGQVVVSPAGATFDEGAGKTTGSPIQVSGGGALNLQGSGASQFFDDTTTSGTFSGNVASGQVIAGGLYPTGSFSNHGTLIVGSVHLPTGDTLTNDGTIDLNRYGLEMFGNLDNTSSGVIGEDGGVSLHSGNTSFTNAGTIYMLYSGGGIEVGGCDCTPDNDKFVNSGTLYAGVQPNSSQWGGNTNSSTIGEEASDTVDLGGTIVPVPVGEPPPPPTPPATMTYDLTGSTQNPPQWTLSCGASVGGGWGLDCNEIAELVDSSNTSLIPTEISVASANSKSSYGQSVTLTATITAQSGPAPTGKVTFFAFSAPQAGTNPTQVQKDLLGTAPLSTTGGVTTAKLTTNLPPGNYEFQAFYPGNSTDLAANSSYNSNITQNVAQATTTTTLAAAPASPAFGKPVTLTATVKPSPSGPANPTGSVSFVAGSVLLGNAPVTTTDGKTTAKITTAALVTGSTSIVADYSGDYNYGASNSAAKTVTESTPASPTKVTVTGPSSVAAGSTYTATTTTNGTGAVHYSLAASPAAPKGMTINSTTGKVTYHVPASGITKFSYAVVATNAGARAESSLVTVKVT